MPNWITGSLKVRGKFEDVKIFFTDNVNRYTWDLDKSTQKTIYKPIPKEQWLVVVDDGPDKNGCRDLYIYYRAAQDDWVYVEGTRRAFISSKSVSAYEKKAGEQVIAFCEINQAWGFDLEDWIELSKKFNVDIRLWGLECGMGFGEEIEIIKGKITIDKELVYDDWSWECPLPWMGG